jgi:hypothetical protein
MADAYESEFMSDGGEVLLRDKTVWRAGVALLGTGTALTLGLGGFLAYTLATLPAETGAWIGMVAPVFAGSVLGACTALFAVLRCTVTTEHVRIQFGLLGPTIPIDAITSCDVQPYHAMSWGGWGVRGFGKNVAYSTTGPGKGVQLVYVQNGVERRVFVTSYDPESIVRAIAEAKAKAKQSRGALAQPRPTRVAADLATRDDDGEEERASVRDKQSRPRS